jgi:hypothetical protein
MISAACTRATPIKTRQQGAGERSKIGCANIGDEIGIGRSNPEAQGGNPRLSQQGALESGVNGGRSNQLLETGMECG